VSRHREHIEKLLTGAVENFERDGELSPMLIICGPRDYLVVRMAPSQDLAPAFAETAMILASFRRDTELIVNIVEAWTRDYKEEEGRKAAETMRHGDMARAHEAGDQNVHTCLVVQGVDTADESQDVSVTHTVDGPRAGEELWMEGPGSGRMPEMMRDAIRLAKQTTLPPNTTQGAIIEVCIRLGLIEFAIMPVLWVPDDEEDAPAP